ncbi:MAG TPA: hypothetical protein VF260_11670 [Bacilli bacterium]
MYVNGQVLTNDDHFQDHILHEVPIQIYLDKQHSDIGFVENISPHYVKINGTFYNRALFTFVSRPGY